MKDIVVVSGCTRRQGLLDLLESQLKEAGIPFILNHIEVPTEEHGLPFNGVSTICRVLDYLAKVAEQTCEYGHVICLDAWDHIFVGTRQTLMDLIRPLPEDRVLFQAARICWPNYTIGNFFPPNPLPWKYVCGGGLCATPQALYALVDRGRHEIESGNYQGARTIDQELWNWMYANSRPFDIDSETKLFYTMAGEPLTNGGLTDLGIVNGTPQNLLTGTRPQFIHFNSRFNPEPFLQAWNAQKVCQ